MGRRAAAKQAFDDIVGRPNVESSHATDVGAALAVMRETGLSFVDACVLWHCRRHGAPPATFDMRLAALSSP